MDKKDNRIDKFHIYISLLSGIVITIVCILNNISFYISCVTILCVMIIFLIIGSIAKIFLNKMLDNEETMIEDDFEYGDGMDENDAIHETGNDENM